MKPHRKKKQASQKDETIKPKNIGRETVETVQQSDDA
jgi:hypothetical protein